ncbi:hypothetical protein JL720_2457 [Aureococcus anophagefferens]|nr:hypothetical protein JL720_2457 [Aureococcus anophagefferens]
MASAQVDGYAGVDGARKEWLLVDEAGRDVLATPGKHYLPGARGPGASSAASSATGPSATPRRRARTSRASGPAASAARSSASTGPTSARALAPLRDGKIFDVGAWRLRRAAGADVAAAAGADVAAAGDAGDDVRPWQIVGIMSRERLDELLEQKRQYDEDAARARRRGGGGAATEAVAFLPAASAGAGSSPTRKPARADRGARGARPPDLCRDGDFDGADALLAPADGPPRDGEFWAASSFARGGGRLRRAPRTRWARGGRAGGATPAAARRSSSSPWRP